VGITQLGALALIGNRQIAQTFLGSVVGKTGDTLCVKAGFSQLRSEPRAGTKDG